VGYVSAQRRAGPTLVVNGGDALFAETTLPVAQREDALARAELIAYANQRMAIDVFVPGQRDLAAGLAHFEALAQRHELPVVAANLVRADGSRPFGGHVVRSINGVRILVVGLVDPAGWSRVDGLRAGPPAEAAAEELRRYARPDDLVVIAARLSLEAAAELAARLPLAAAVLAADPRSFTFLPREVRRSGGQAGGGVPTPVAAAGHSGQHLIRFEIFARPGDVRLHGGAALEDAREERAQAAARLARDPSDRLGRKLLRSARRRLEPFADQTHYLFHFDELGSQHAEDPDVAARRAHLGSKPQGQPPEPPVSRPR